MTYVFGKKQPVPVRDLWSQNDFVLEEDRRRTGLPVPEGRYHCQDDKVLTFRERVIQAEPWLILASADDCQP